MTSYNDIKAMNWSSLKRLARSPRLYHYRTEHPEPDKPAYALGRAVHTALLEPDQFDARYAVFDGIRRGKAWDAWQEEHPDVESLKPHEMTDIEQIVSAVMAHPKAAEALRGGRAEEVMQWHDESGIACKGRADYITPRRVVDLKTTANLSRFAADVERFMYHGQIAFYLDGARAAKALPADAEPPLIIAVEADDAGDRCFDCGVFVLSDELLAAGRALYRRLLDQFAACEAAQWWPGLYPEVTPLMPSRWLVDAATEEEEGF